MPFKTKAAPRLRRLGAAALVSVVGPMAPAMALTPQVEAEVRYQLECFALIFRDPEAHVEQCNPVLQTGYVPVTSIGSNPPPAPAKADPPPPPPPPPPAEEEEEEEEDECELNPCGCQYNPT